MQQRDKLIEEIWRIEGWGISLTLSPLSFAKFLTSKGDSPLELHLASFSSPLLSNGSVTSR